MIHFGFENLGQIEPVRPCILKIEQVLSRFYREYLVIVVVQSINKLWLNLTLFC